MHQSVFRSVGRWFAFSVRETRLRYACSMHALTDSRGDAESATAAPRHAAPCTLCTHVRACPGLRVQGEGEGGSGGRLGAMLICMRRHDGRHRSSGGCATLGAEGSEGKHRSLSPVHPPRPLPLLPAAPRPSTPRVIRTFYLPSLSPPSPVPRPAVLRDFPRFLLSIRHGVIFPSCSRVAFFSFPSTTTNLRDEATSETRKQRTIVSPFSLPRFDRRPFFPFFLSRTQRT